MGEYNEIIRAQSVSIQRIEDKIDKIDEKIDLLKNNCLSVSGLVDKRLSLVETTTAFEIDKVEKKFKSWMVYLAGSIFILGGGSLGALNLNKITEVIKLFLK